MLAPNQKGPNSNAQDQYKCWIDVVGSPGIPVEESGDQSSLRALALTERPCFKQ